MCDSYFIWLPTQGLSSEISTKGTGKLVAIKCDVTKEEEVLAMFEQVKRELGGADVIICNAGLAHLDPLLSGNTSQWREMTEVFYSRFLQ